VDTTFTWIEAKHDFAHGDTIVGDFGSGFNLERHECKSKGGDYGKSKQRTMERTGFGGGIFYGGKNLKASSFHRLRKRIRGDFRV
jgi:hypothetical protein